MGSALYSVFYFVGIYFTLVEGYHASKAGIQLLYYIPGIAIGVYTAMFLCNVWPRQTFFTIVAGSVLETVGIAMITFAVTTRKATLVNVMMIVAGTGYGVRVMPVTLHTAGIWPERIASAYSVMRFAMPFGGTLALTVMGSVFNNKMGAIFRNASVLSAGADAGISLHGNFGLDDISRLPPAEQLIVRDIGSRAVMWAFVSILPFLGVALVASLALGNVWIVTAKKKDAQDEAMISISNTNKSGSEVIYTSYLLAVFKGTVRQEKQVHGPTVPRNEKSEITAEVKAEGISSTS